MNGKLFGKNGDVGHVTL